MDPITSASSDVELGEDWIWRNRTFFYLCHETLFQIHWTIGKFVEAIFEPIFIYTFKVVWVSSLWKHFFNTVYLFKNSESFYLNFSSKFYSNFYDLLSLLCLVFVPVSFKFWHLLFCTFFNIHDIHRDEYL